jgi:hypothetical protein
MFDPDKLDQFVVTSLFTGGGATPRPRRPNNACKIRDPNFLK